MKVNPNATIKDFIKYGFTQSLAREEDLIFMRTLDKKFDISFSFYLNKESMSIRTVDIIDEDFGQHYNYQYYLSKNPEHKVSLEIKKKVDDRLLDMQENGLIVDFKVGDYV